jgi:type I restriction enzyme M protein
MDEVLTVCLPRVNASALMFVQHTWSKREDVKPKEHKQGSSRLATVFPGPPMFTGGAGSGDSEIRRWLLQNDCLEAIVALPQPMFYSIGIGTSVWVTNIARQSAKLDSVRAPTERTSALLKERRVALIAAAVTSQLNVEATA